MTIVVIIFRTGWFFSLSPLLCAPGDVHAAAAVRLEVRRARPSTAVVCGRDFACTPSTRTTPRDGTGRAMLSFPSLGGASVLI